MTTELKDMPENIVLNKDRLSSIIKSYKESVKREHVWPTPLGILISVLLCIAATSNFQAIWFLSEDQVALLVYLLGLFSFFWLIKALLNLRKDEADESFYTDVFQSLKNSPDYTVVYIIKLTRDEIPRVLVEKKPTWDCYFLPYVSRPYSGDISSQNVSVFQKTIASYLGVSSDAVSIEHFRDFCLVSEKYSPKDNVSKQFNFDFFFFTVEKEKMLDDYEQSPFRVGGKEFYWMTLGELMDDPKTMERNGDVVSHLEKNFTEFFANTKDSFC